MTVKYLLRGQLAFLVRRGFEVHILAGPRARLDDIDAGEGASYRPIRGLSREIHLMSDLWTLFEIFRTLRQLRPDIVNASTPKAGLLGMLASFLARVPNRIYTLRGLRLETTRGLEQGILTITEKIAMACAHRVVAVSTSLRARALHLGLVAPGKIEVLDAGSSNGVDTSRFHGELKASDVELRRLLDLPDNAPVIGFVGRLTRDKGIDDLTIAFTEQVQPRIPSARLLIVGDFETGDSVGVAVQKGLLRNPAVTLTGYVEDSAPYYRLMDVLAFPSYREGFPNAPLEAAASEIPVAGYAATGTVDAVIDGTTGTLVRVGDVAALGDALCSYLINPDLRHRHGKAGRSRVEDHFRSEIIWNEWKKLYLREASS
ncbi:MAG: glycosyltransferase family 4 protein [Acidobacteria bacterium]|nr:glycosyltransferase family 4 protein [Acidobacteriota bacterium]